MDYTTVNGTPVVGEDYKRSTGTLVFSKDDRTRPLVIDDNKECLLRRLFLPVGMV